MQILRRKITPPAREVADYSSEERNRFREAFGSIAAGYRRHARIAYSAMGAGAACVLLGMILPKFAFPWLISSIFIVFFVVLGSAMSAPSLVCPGCSNYIEHSFGPYCPECGKKQLQPGSWSGQRRCIACGKTMGGGKARGYTIRFCTHCGVMLEEKGL
jgi:hypothetical protein